MSVMITYDANTCKTETVTLEFGLGRKKIVPSVALTRGRS